MTYEGTLKKMLTEIGNPIQYYLNFEADFLNINQLLNKKIEISFTGYQCLCCSKKKKIFRQGFCYDCFYSSPAVGDWIMKPELSTAHLGIADRDLDFETQVQLVPHIVYLALSGDVKVGVTRKTQTPTRWIDQGATAAIVLLETPNRYLAGITEVELKKHYSDKTNWRKMLQDFKVDIDLITEKKKAVALVPKEVSDFIYSAPDDYYELIYPILQHPKKVSSLSLDKTQVFSGILVGIKGQYLMFDDGTVFNVRTFEGYSVKINV